jgi:DNA polymerase-1
MATDERTNLTLIDGSGYIFRAFFALPQMNNSRGMPTNAVFGFIRMMLKLLRETRPTHIAVVFDAKGKTFRDDLFADYKANRAVMPTDLGVQIPFIHRAVEAMRIRSVVREGVEADDVIGTIAKRAAAENFEVTLITADKDFNQLVGPHVTLWDTMRDRRTGVREIRDRFGVEPAGFAEIQALTGDQVDNIKGIPGIGEKTAVALIQKFGTVKDIYARLDEVEQSGIPRAKKVVELLREHRADAELSAKLVKIDTDVPVDIAPRDLTWPGIDTDATATLLREMEFSSLLRELAPAHAELPSGGATQAASTIIADRAQLGAAIESIKAAQSIAFDLDDAVDGNFEIYADGRSYIVSPGLAGELAPILSNPSIAKTCHDLKTQLRALGRIGIALNGVDFDTMIAGFLVNSGRPEPEVNDLYREYAGSLDSPAPPPAGRAHAIAAIRAPLEVRIRRDGMDQLFREIEMPTISILAEMEATGIAIDCAALAETGASFTESANRLEAECYELAGRRFNLNSPNQLRAVLFDELKLPSKGLKKTKSGFSTDADTLEKLAGAHPMPARLLEYRAVSKLKSTYTDALGQMIDPRDGRVHTTFHQALAATGRVSSSDPNLQNIPTRTEDGRRIRRAFIPCVGAAFVSVDYSQIDLRVLAHLSGDATLVDAFGRGEDIHVRTAVELLGVDAAHVGPVERRIAKSINFGIIYGMGPNRLAAQLEIPVAEAADYIKRYFERLPGVRSFIDATIARGREVGFVATMYGRRRYLPELASQPGGARAQAERIAVNTPIQGTAADLIKLAMVRLDATLKQKRLDARIILQVHDELLLEVAVESIAEVAAISKREMEGVAKLKVPLVAEAKSGPNWAQLSRI